MTPTSEQLKSLEEVKKSLEQGVPVDDRDAGILVDLLKAKDREIAGLQARLFDLTSTIEAIPFSAREFPTRLGRAPSPRMELLERVAEAAKICWRSLVPFSGSINTTPIPGIKSRCRVNDGRYTIPEISNELYDALAALDKEAANG